MSQAASPAPSSPSSILPLPSSLPLFPRQLFYACTLSIYFILLYGFAMKFTAARAADGEHIPSFYFEWEKHIPLIPAFIIPYMSIDLFFFAAPFLTTSLKELRTHATRVFFGISVATLFFLLTPLHYDFPRPTPEGPLGYVFAFLHAFDGPYNLAPSLHITLRSLLWMVYVRHTTGILRWSVRTWFLLIGLSTLFVFQHHVIDLITGQLLAMLCYYLFPDLAPSPSAAPPEQSLASSRSDAPPFPTAQTRNLSIALRYGAASLACILLAHYMPRFGWTLIWPATALGLLSAAYFGLGPVIFHKPDGSLTHTTRFLLLPYLLGARASYHRYRRTLTPTTEIAPTLHIGRHLLPTEQHLLPRGTTAVLDLAPEFSAPAFARRGTLTYRSLPMLDLTPPTPAELHEAVTFIAANKVTYVHCALGLSRAAAVAAAWLLAQNLAKSPEDAIEQVRAKRPAVVLPPKYLRALHDYQTALRQSATVPISPPATTIPPTSPTGATPQ